MTNELTPLGSIHISPDAIATITYHATMQSYGVVGLTSKNLVDGLKEIIIHHPMHGVEVKYDGNKIEIDVYIIVEYGTRIKTVATSVANTIKYQVEKTVGLPIHAINVHLQGLRVSEYN